MKTESEGHPEDQDALQTFDALPIFNTEISPRKKRGASCILSAYSRNYLSKLSNGLASQLKQIEQEILEPKKIKRTI